MTTGERIRAIRISKGWSMAKLADKSGCCPTSICHYEKGKTVPHLDKICCIAQALGTTVEALTGNAEYCRDREILKLKAENARLKKALIAVRIHLQNECDLIREAVFPDVLMDEPD